MITHLTLNVIWWPFCFQNEVKITLRQAFLTVNISGKFDETSFSIKTFEYVNDF